MSYDVETQWIHIHMLAQMHKLSDHHSLYPFQMIFSQVCKIYIIKQNVTFIFEVIMNELMVFFLKMRNYLIIGLLQLNMCVREVRVTTISYSKKLQSTGKSVQSISYSSCWRDNLSTTLFSMAFNDLNIEAYFFADS